MKAVEDLVEKPPGNQEPVACKVQSMFNISSRLWNNMKREARDCPWIFEMKIRDTDGVGVCFRQLRKKKVKDTKHNLYPNPQFHRIMKKASPYQWLAHWLIKNAMANWRKHTQRHTDTRDDSQYESDDDNDTSMQADDREDEDAEEESNSEETEEGVIEVEDTEEQEEFEEDLPANYKDSFYDVSDGDDMDLPESEPWRIEDNVDPLRDFEDDGVDGISDKRHKSRNQNGQFITAKGLVASRNRFGLTLKEEEAALREYATKLKRKVF